MDSYQGKGIAIWFIVRPKKYDNTLAICDCFSDDTRCQSDTILDNPDGAQLEFVKRFVMDRVLR